MQTEREAFFAKDVAPLTRTLAHLAERIDPVAQPQKDDRFDQLNEAMYRANEACRQLESSIDGDPERLKEAKRSYQHHVWPWLDRSWIGHRARAKPRGYPGDYELLTALYDQRPKTLGFGGYLDLYLLDMVLTKAIRARWQAARQFLAEEIAQRRGDVFILNVACGPCREYVGGLEHPGQCNIHVTCIDNDRQALEYVQAHVITVAGGIPDIRCAQYNALRMCSAQANIRNFGRCDIIYSIGLCDYIPDRPLVRMLQGLRQSLNQGGVLFVAFKDARRYDKTEYQWLLDWYFLQRTEEDCLGLFEQAGFDPESLQMTREATGVIMNVIGRVKHPAAVRMHVPPKRVREPRHAATTPHRSEPAKTPTHHR